MFWAEIWKKYQNFSSENFPFLVVKFSIYLNRRVFVMRNIAYPADSKQKQYVKCLCSMCTFNITGWVHRLVNVMSNNSPFLRNCIPFSHVPKTTLLFLGKVFFLFFFLLKFNLNLYPASIQRRNNIDSTLIKRQTLNQRWIDVVSTLSARWVQIIIIIILSLEDLQPLFTREINYVTSFLFYCTSSPIFKGIYSERKWFVSNRNKFCL